MIKAKSKILSIVLVITTVLSLFASSSEIMSMATVHAEVTATLAMYRMYNPNSGEHFYTSGVGEKDSLIVAGWNYEGIGWYAPNDGHAVYRLYNPNAGDHHYTMSEDENHMLMAQGWRYEGIGWFSDGDKKVPVYRQYNRNAKGAGAHNYTTSSGERDMLIQATWEDEGIGWYASALPPSDDPTDPTDPEGDIEERPVYTDDSVSPSGRVSITELNTTKKSAQLSATNGVEPYGNYWFGKSIDGDISDNLGLAYSLSVSDQTRFASDSYAPDGYNKDELIEWGKYSGLNTDILKEYGYTGQGATIAYVDQPIGSHEIYNDINLHYKNNSTSETSMHGPAVLSLLAGKNTGTAPDAEVYYYAHAAWEQDQTTHAECLYQIIEQNKSLSDDKKIRMVGFSDNIDENEANADAFREAVAACETAGIMVWFCGEYGPMSFNPMSNKDDFSNLVVSQWWNESFNPELVFVPESGRTTAANEMGNKYIYWGQGGLSWTMPYVLGLYADALAIDSTLTQSELRQLIVNTAYTNSKGQKIVYPVNFIATVLENAGRTQDATTLRNAEKADEKYIYAVYNSSQISSSDVTAIKKYLSNVTDAKVLLADTKNADAKDIFVSLKADAKKRGGIVKGVQIFGTNSIVPSFSTSYKVQMANGEMDEMGIMASDLFYGNFRNQVSDVLKYSAYDHYEKNIDVTVTPDWPVARLPLSSGEYSAFFNKYNSYALNSGLEQQDIVNFSNPIFASTYHTDDMGTFLNRANSEWGILKTPYRLYGNLKGDYPVSNEVLGGFEVANLTAENKKGSSEFIINSHGQWNNIDNAYFVNGQEQRESFVNMDTINTVLSANPYYLDLWTCNNGWEMENNLTTKALSGQCLGVFSATHIISNNGVNCYASLSDMKKSNFYYFYYSYLKALNSGNTRSRAFYKAQRAYANALVEDMKEPLRLEGNVQFNLCNLITYHNFGVLEPNAATMSMTQ
ncbi:MAG: hypothetical protein K5644_09460 [Lachnospiraceae bacterium]|nr:hypothetical protein [Lachnospiraceae bacterium]